MSFPSAFSLISIAGLVHVFDLDLTTLILIFPCHTCHTSTHLRTVCFQLIGVWNSISPMFQNPLQTTPDFWMQSLLKCCLLQEEQPCGYLLSAHTLRKEPFWLFKKTQRKISKNTLRIANCLALQESYRALSRVNLKVGSTALFIALFLFCVCPFCVMLWDITYRPLLSARAWLTVHKVQCRQSKEFSFS